MTWIPGGGCESQFPGLGLLLHFSPKGHLCFLALSQHSSFSCFPGDGGVGTRAGHWALLPHLPDWPQHTAQSFEMKGFES